LKFTQETREHFGQVLQAKKDTSKKYAYIDVTQNQIPKA
jgi:hypothetical protein